ncbi:MAG: ribosome-binding factor A, partial [Nitrospirae bacterium]|nr:ribosome-binding factor A [Nitrospirota bacterium]
MRLLLIPPSISLIDEIASHLCADGNDYSRNLVVFPGRRPAHFIRRAIARNLKSAFVPPLIFSIDDFVEYLCESDGRPVKGLLALDAMAILYEIHEGSSGALKKGSFLSLDSFLSVGMMIYRDIEELYIEGINPSRLKTVDPLLTSLNITDDAKERLQSLAFFYDRFYKRVGELGFSSRSMRYRAAAEALGNADHDRATVRQCDSAAGNFGEFKRIIFGGFFALTHWEQEIFKTLSDKDGSVFIFHDGDGIPERLKDMQFDISRIERKDDVVEAPDLHFYSSPDAHGQVFALAGMLEKSGLINVDGGKKPDEDTVIVLPSSDGLFPLLRHCLSMYDGKDYNISMGYPLIRTPIYSFLNNMMDLISSIQDGLFYVPDYLKFALHPYTKNIYFKGSPEITRIMFHAIEEHLSEYESRGNDGGGFFIDISDLERDEKLFNDILKRLPETEGKISASDLSAHLRSIHDNTIRMFLS